MKVRARWIIVTLAVAAAIAIAGWAIFNAGRARHDHTLTLYGNVDIREIQPAFNDSGTVTAMKVQEGARVTKGELLATLDDTRYAARLAQARQQAQSLKATLDKLLRGSRPEEIAQAKASMSGLRSVYENNRTLYARTAQLVPRGAASTEELDNAKAQLDASRENFEAAKQTYLLAVKGPRAEDIATARAQYQSAQAAVNLAERDMHDTNLYAPQDGIVENRILEPGDMASPSTPVYTIALTEPLWVRTYVPETQLGRVRLGMAATVGTDSYPGHTYHGWVGYLSPTSEFTPKSIETPELRAALVYQLRVYVCDARNELRLGMPATVRLDLNPAAASPAKPGCGAADAGRR